MQVVVVYGPPGRALEQYAALIQQSVPDARVATTGIPDDVTQETTEDVRRALLAGRDPAEAPILAKVADLVLELGLERAGRAGAAQVEDLPR